MARILRTVWVRPGAPVHPRTYHPRATQDSVLVQLLRDHLDAFLERCAVDGTPGLPVFVERELRAMVACGDVSRGFVRLECADCRGPRVVPFSCKTHLCPSCAGRRMAEQACHLVDRVLPRAPYRQWVLTLPWQVARAAAYDARLCGRVFAIFADEVGRWQRTRARKLGVEAPRAGAVLEIQRFADGLQLFVHAHLLAPDGVFHETSDGRVRWRGIGPPTVEAVETVVGRVTARVRRLLERQASTADADGPGPASEHPLLEQCADVAPSRRVTMPGWADRRARSRGRRARKPLCVRSPEGLEVHAAVHVTAADRAGLQRLCQYLARPPICEDRLVRLPGGAVEVRLKRPRRGVRSLVFEPVAFLARMAALIPRPRLNMRRYYGVLSAAHSWRARVVPSPPCPDKTGKPVAPRRPARMGWADLLKRTWNIDSLRCPFCQGRLRVVSAVLDPTAIQAIIAAVHLADGRAAEAARHPASQVRGPPVQAAA